MKITWFAIDCNLYTHPKMLRLSSSLKTDVDTLVGKLGRLWAWAKLSGNENGEIGELPAQEIADIMRWKKGSKALLSALIECGFIDASEDGIFLHGWAELNGNMTAKKRRDNDRKKKESSTEKPEKFHGNSTEIPRKIFGVSEEIPRTQYSTVQIQEKEIPPGGGISKEPAATSAMIDHDRGRVLSFLIDNIDKNPSPRCRGDLMGYIRDFGPDLCIRVMEEAMDAGQDTRKWAYIDKIFKRLYQDKIRTVDDFERRKQDGRTGSADGDKDSWTNLPGVTYL